VLTLFGRYVSIEGLFKRIFGADVNFDTLTPEEFEYKVSGRAIAAAAQGKPITPEVYRTWTDAEKNAFKDDSKPVDYLATLNSTRGLPYVCSFILFYSTLLLELWPASDRDRTDCVLISSDLI
jgi:hypothetical protein